VARVPIGPQLALAVEIVTVFAALLAVVGVRAKPALVVLTLGAFYLCSIAQLTGFVWHDMHLLWMCALLSASPCDRALAFDHPAAAPPSTAFAVPLVFARALLGVVYFFPGYYKLREQGLGFALSDNLANHIHWKWAEHGHLPVFRVDQHPWLLHGGGLFVLAFEIAAPFLFWFRRTRALGAALGFAFHLLAQALFFIPFASLWACYVVLLDVPKMLRWLGRRRKAETETETETEAESGTATASAWVVGGLLLLGAVVQGARGQMQSYPFACYPTFQWNPGTRMPDLRVTAVMADGREVDVPFARDARGYRTQRQWGEVFALAGFTHPADASRLRAYYIQLTRGEPSASALRGAVRVWFSRVSVPVDPDVPKTPEDWTELATLELKP